MPNIRLNLTKATKIIEAPFQVAQTASDEPESISRRAIPLSEELSESGKILLKINGPEVKNYSAPPRANFEQTLARGQNSQDEGIIDPPEQINSLNQLYKMLSSNNFCL